MTTLANSPASQVLPALDDDDLRVDQMAVIKSEIIKLRTLRSTWITLVLIVVLLAGVGILVSGVQANHWPQARPEDKASFNPVFTSLVGTNFSQLAVGVLGVLLFSGEYATGMIRSTLAAVPKRLPVLWAKLGIYLVMLLALTIPSAFIAFLGGQALLSSQHIQTSLSAPGVTREVVGAALYLVVIGLIGVALGAITRNTAAGISTLVAILFVLPPILQVLPSSWRNSVGKVLPSQAGQALWANPDTPHLTPWVGFAVMCLWAAVAVAGAAVTLTRRDA